jgi:hypothetical protein
MQSGCRRSRWSRKQQGMDGTLKTLPSATSRNLRATQWGSAQSGMLGDGAYRDAQNALFFSFLSLCLLYCFQLTTNKGSGPAPDN